MFTNLALLLTALATVGLQDLNENMILAAKSGQTFALRSLIESAPVELQPTGFRIQRSA